MSSELNKYRDEARTLQLTLDKVLWPLVLAGFQDSNSTHKVNLSSDVVPGLALMCSWLRPYIAELCLKSLYQLETGKDQKNRHDLIWLFGRLSCNTQKELEDSYREHISKFDAQCSELSDLLEAHKDHFINWRYLHEGKASGSELTLLDSAIAAMFDIIQNKVDGAN